MPSNWLAMDDNFPTFTGEESPSQQISALHNYLYQMREGLQYSMRNLTAENFNETALQQLTDDQKNAVAEELRKLQSTISSFSNEINSLSARVSSVENLGGRVNDAENAITYLQEDAAKKSETLKNHEESIAVLERTASELQDGQSDLEEQLGTAQGDIDVLQTDVDALKEAIDGENGLTGRVDLLENTLSGEGGIEEQLQEVKAEQEKQSGVVKVAEDGSATLGGENQTVYLVGQIYINGKLYESGGEAT